MSNVKKIIYLKLWWYYLWFLYGTKSERWLNILIYFANKEELTKWIDLLITTTFRVLGNETKWIAWNWSIVKLENGKFFVFSMNATAIVIIFQVMRILYDQFIYWILKSNVKYFLTIISSQRIFLFSIFLWILWPFKGSKKSSTQYLLHQKGSFLKKAHKNIIYSPITHGKRQLYLVKWSCASIKIY